MPVANNGPAPKKPGIQPKKKPKTGPVEGTGVDTSVPTTKKLAKLENRIEDPTPGKRKTKPQLLLEQAQAEIYEKFGVANFHPITFLLSVAADPGEDMTMRKDCAKAAAPYLVPTLKGVEVSGPDGGPVAVDLTSSKERLAQMIKANTPKAPSDAS